MQVDGVALIPKCAECEALWLPADEERWQAHLGCDEHLDEPAELAFYCPDLRGAGVRAGLVRETHPRRT